MPTSRPAPTAVATPEAGAASALPPGAARRWVLVTLQDAQGRIQNPTPVPTLDLLDPTRVRGSDGCVGFTGRLEPTNAPRADASSGAGVGIAIADLVSTTRACAEANGIESRYLRILQDADRLTLAGTRLALRAGDAALIFGLDRMATIQPVQPNSP
ncbi:MAG: META domain-containing protein [Micrococcales bacterium]|nr:META domain-containing protein [Micrococcales bacterium]